MKRSPIICAAFVLIGLIPMAAISIGGGIHGSVQGMSASSGSSHTDSGGDDLLFLNLLTLYFVLGAIASMSSDGGLRRGLFVAANIAVVLGCIAGASGVGHFSKLFMTVVGLYILPTVLWLPLMIRKQPNQALQTTPVTRSDI